MGKNLSGAQKRKKKKEREKAAAEALADMERLKLGPTKLWTGLVVHHKDVFVSHVISKLNRTDRFFFSKVNRESWSVLAYAGVELLLKLQWCVHECSSISTLEWAWNNTGWGEKSISGRVRDQAWFCWQVACTNKLEFLKWARDVKHCEWDEKTILQAAFRGNLEMLKYCFSNGCPCDEGESCKHAARKGHLDCVRFLFDKVKPSRKTEKEAAGQAACGGHMDMLKYFVEERKISDEVKSDCVGNATMYGQLDCLKYLVEEARAPLTDWRDIAFARYNEHTECENYLREKGCPEPTDEEYTTYCTNKRSSIKRRNQNEENWKSLRTTRDDLSLDRTLPTGQSFRWQKVEEYDENDENEKKYSTYVGVIGRRVVQIRERMEFEEEEEKSYETTTIEFRVLNTNESNICKNEDKENGEQEEEQVTKDVRAYFNLDDPIPLKDLFEQFSKADPYRFGRLSAYVRGARTLRQPPAECLISFVCSSNNNIARIKKMVESLCEKYGEELVCNVSSRSSSRSSGSSGRDDDEENEVNDKEEINESKIYHAFPTVEQLAEKCDEQTLRDLGFGYRAKFIPAMAKELVKRGGEAYLLKLRDAPQTEEEKYRAITELTSLPGVGPKVAGCAALFSLDKKSVVPVDTHVWQLAREHFDPNGELASMETTASTTKGSANEEGAEQQRHKESSTPTTPTKQKDKPLSITPKMMKKCEEMLVSIYGAYAGYAHTALFVAELPTVRESLPEHLRTPTKADKKRGEKNGEKKPEKKKRKFLKVDGENKSDDDGA
ncbi:unnamed protein product [Bathycoccus prasinos]